MIEVSLSLIERDVVKISPKICLHWDMRRTEGVICMLVTEEVRPKLDIDLRGVVDMFRNWRPTCWFGSREEGDSDCDSEVGNIDVPEIEDVPGKQTQTVYRAQDKVHTFVNTMHISLPNPMFDGLLELSHSGDSNKWSNRIW